MLFRPTIITTKRSKGFSCHCAILKTVDILHTCTHITQLLLPRPFLPLNVARLPVGRVGKGPSGPVTYQSKRLNAKRQRRTTNTL